MNTFGVYLSSTWVDLRAEREAVERAIHRLAETKFVGMEYFGARNESISEISVGELDRAEVYVGLFAGRYGSGITEMEYRRAVKLGRRCLIYFKASSTTPLESCDIGEAAVRLARLKAELQARHGIGEFGNPDDLAARVTADLHRLLFDDFRTLEARPSLDAYRGALTAFFDDEFDRSLRDYLGAVQAFADSDYRSLSFPFGTTLADVYVQLEMALVGRAPPGKSDGSPEHGESERESIRWLLVGEPGAGKSTMLRHLAHQAWDNPTSVGLTQKYLPMLVRLSSVARAAGAAIEERLWEAMADARDILMEAAPPRGWFNAWASRLSSPWLLLLDGFDEVPQDRRREVLRWIGELLHKGFSIVVTSRLTDETMPRGALVAMLDQYEVKPLTAAQQERLARKWLGERANAFLEQLARVRTSAVAGTPLLTTVAALVFQRRGALPQSRAALYQLFVEAWWKEALQRGVGDEIGPDLADVALDALQFLARTMTAAPDRRSRAGLAEQLRGHFDAGSDRLQYLTAQRVERFILVMSQRSGVLQCTASEVEWLHNSFREYLAGEDIAGTDPDTPAALSACQSWYDRDRWREAILFALGVWSERGLDVTPLLERIVADATGGVTRAAVPDPQPWMDRLGDMSIVFAAAAVSEGVRVSPAFKNRLVDELCARARDYAHHGIAVRALSHVVCDHTAQVLGRLVDDPAVAGRISAVAADLLAAARAWNPRDQTGPAALKDLAALGRLDDVASLAGDAELPVAVRVTACEELFKRGRVDKASPSATELLQTTNDAHAITRTLRAVIAAQPIERSVAMMRSSDWPLHVRVGISNLLAEIDSQTVASFVSDESLPLDVRIAASFAVAADKGNLRKAIEQWLPHLKPAHLINVLAQHSEVGQCLVDANAWELLRDVAAANPPSRMLDAALAALKLNGRITELESLFSDTRLPRSTRLQAAEAAYAVGDGGAAASVAIGLYGEMLHETPHDVASRLRRAELLCFAKPQFDEAIAECTTALATQPNSVRAFYTRGCAYHRLARYADARVDFVAAQRLSTTLDQRWMSLIRLGIVECDMDEHHNAVEAFDEAARLDADQALATRFNWFETSQTISLHYVARHKEALTLVERIISRDGGSAILYALRGATHLKLGNVTQALNDLDRALHLQPSYEWALEQRAECYERTGRYAEAIAELKRILSQEPRNRAVAERIRALTERL